MTTLNRRWTYDNALLLKDAGLVAASAAATVAGSAKFLDLGVGRVDSRVILDVTAIEVDTGDEKYLIKLEASNDNTFATGKVVLAERALGIAALIGASANSAAGRYEMPFTNDLDGTVYEFVRIFTTIVGTIATGVNFTAYLAKE